jgi:hypothetical protein
MIGIAFRQGLKISVKKYWWLNQMTYASEFLARKRFDERI